MNIKMLIENKKFIKTILVTTIIGITLIGGCKLLNFTLFNFTINKIVKRGDFDKIYDYEKDPYSGGYYLWVVGSKDGKFSGARYATDSTVKLIGWEVFGRDYKTQESYYKDGGPMKLKEVIEKDK